MNDQLNGPQQGAHASRVAVIANASSRLGRAMAIELARQGFSLALCALKPSELENTVDEAFNSVEVSPFKVSAYECDPRDERSVGLSAKEIFEDFGRVDVLCLIEQRVDETGLNDDEMEGCLPVLGEDGSAFRSLNVNISDVRYYLNHFYPLLKKEKPIAPPMKFFGNIPAGARRVPLQTPEGGSDDEDEYDPDEEVERMATSLLLYLTTPDSIVCRAGRTSISSRVRAIEAVLEGVNAEAVARNEPVRTSIAVIGTLYGELPFWRFDRERFRLESKQGEHAWMKMLALKQQNRIESKLVNNIQNQNPNNNLTGPPAKRENSSSYEVIQSLIPKRFLRARRASRSRGGTDATASAKDISHASVVELDEEEDEEEEDGSVIEQEVEVEQQADDDVNVDDEDYIPPPSPVHSSYQVVPLEKLTAECLSHAEACEWITWGLSRGRLRIVVGYDVLFLQSAWVPNAFLNRLFSFNSQASRNLLPIRTKDTFLPTTETVRRAQAKYDEERRRRQRAREVVTMMAVIFVLFPPAVALGLLFLLFIWHWAVTSSGGHAATERVVTMVLFLVSLRKTFVIRQLWDGFRTVERTVFGFLSRTVFDIGLKLEEAWARQIRGKRRRSTLNLKQM